jgi:hypothetical protein
MHVPADAAGRQPRIADINWDGEGDLEPRLSLEPTTRSPDPAGYLRAI